MTIRHLYIFRIVCEEMSVTKAAKRLYMTQPAVSHVINDLEKEAGAPLFDRVSRKISLNQRGEILLGKIFRLLELYEDLEKEMKKLEEQEKLRIGSSITIANFWLPEMICRFERDCPDARAEVCVDSARETIGKLDRGEIDIALIEGSAYMDRYEKITFSSYEVSFACSPGYLEQIGKKEGELILPGELAFLRLLFREQGSAIRDAVDGVFLQRGLTAQPFWTSVNSQALLNAARQGLGVTALPDVLLKPDLDAKNLIRLPVDGVSLTNESHLVYHREKYLTRPIKGFIDVVEKSSHGNGN